MKFDLYQAVADLRAGWPDLPDVDRAEAIVSILSHKMSGRTLAAALGCNESLIRQLKPVARATAAEKQQSRDGKISTRKLNRIVRERETQVCAQLARIQRTEQTKAAKKGAEDIVKFLCKERIPPSYAERIWTEAIGILRGLEEAGQLTDIQRPKRMPTAEIASRCWPAFAPNGDGTISYINVCAAWLARWTTYAMPDSGVREQAYQLAWSQIARGYSLSA